MDFWWSKRELESGGSLKGWLDDFDRRKWVRVENLSWTSPMRRPRNGALDPWGLLEERNDGMLVD